MSKHEQETQEFAATCCQYSCQSLLGSCFGLILGIPPLILAGLGRSSLATVPCGLRSSSQLTEIGIIVYLVEFGIVLLLILGSIFWQKTVRSFTFGLCFGLLIMLIPFLLTELGAFSDSWLRCFKLEG